MRLLAVFLAAVPAVLLGQAPDKPEKVVLKSGTRMPLTLLSTVSTRNAAAGDRVYMETMMPLVIDRQVVVPAGSHVTGTVTQADRPGKVKGKGQLFLRFDTLLLPNGVSLDLSGRLGAIDGESPGTLSRDEGKVVSQGSEGRDAVTVAGTSLGGAAMGNWIGGRGTNAAIGAGAGAAAGLGTVLLTRGPDAVLPRGSMVEMVLQRDVEMATADIPGGSPTAVQRRSGSGAGSGQRNNPSTPRIPMGRMGIPW